VHLNRIKPFLSQSDKIVETNSTDEDNKVIIHSSPIPSDDENEEDTPPHSSKFLNHPRHLLPTLPDEPPREEPPKKKRGRPKKTQKLTVGQEMQQPPSPPAEEMTEHMPVIEKRITRSQLLQMTPEQKAQYLAASYVNSLKGSTPQKTKVKRKTLKNKPRKNGSSNVKWSKLQKMYFKLFGDIDGATYQMEHEPEVPVHDPDGDDGSEHSNQSSYYSDWASSSETELEFSDDEHEPEPPPPPERKPERQPEPEQPKAHPKEAQKDDQRDHQGRRERNEEKVEKAPHKMAEGRQEEPSGAMLHLSKDELSRLQRLRRDVQEGHAVAHQAPHSPPSSSLLMSKAGFMSTRTLPRSPNIVPPPVVHSPPASKHQGATSSHGHEASGSGTSHSQVLKMGSSTSKKDDPLRSPTFRPTVPKTGPTAKSTISLKRLTSPVSKPYRQTKGATNDIEVLARIVGLSSGALSKQAKQELVGQLVIEAATDAMPTLARPGSDPEPSNVEQQPPYTRSKTPALTKTEQAYKDRYQTVSQAQAILKAEEELAQEGLTRPTRSTSRGPPIGTLPRVPIEYRKRMTAAELHRLEWLELEKKQAEERRALEDKKRHSSY
jgi:hypothetical protein